MAMREIRLIGGPCHGMTWLVHENMRHNDIAAVAVAEPEKVQITVQDYDVTGAMMKRHQYRLHEFHWHDGSRQEVTMIGLPVEANGNPFRFVIDIAFRNSQFGA